LGFEESVCRSAWLQGEYPCLWDVSQAIALSTPQALSHRSSTTRPTVSMSQCCGAASRPADGGSFRPAKAYCKLDRMHQCGRKSGMMGGRAGSVSKRSRTSTCLALRVSCFCATGLLREGKLENVLRDACRSRSPKAQENMRSMDCPCNHGTSTDFRRFTMVFPRRTVPIYSRLRRTSQTARSVEAR
jgi:hypothetical protein